MRKYILLVAAVTTILSGCGSLDMCGNQVLQQVASPDGRFKAVIFERDCGATSGYSTQVSVLPSGTKLPNESGNVFVIDDSDGSARLGSSGLRVWAKWLGARHLKIVYGAEETVFHNAPKYKDIAISYAKQ